MKVFVTGVAGQLGHDVMNELAKRGYEGVGSDIAPSYSGISDGTAVTTMPYISMDITDAAAVEKTLQDVKPDVVVHCAAWTAVGKAPVGVAKLAKKHGVRVLAFAGSVTKEARACNAAGIDAFFPIVRGVTTLEEAMKKEVAAEKMRESVEQVFRVLAAATGSL